MSRRRRSSACSSTTPRARPPERARVGGCLPGKRLPDARAALGSSRPRRALPLDPPQVRVPSPAADAFVPEVGCAAREHEQWSDSAGATPAAASGVSGPGHQAKRVPSLPLSTGRKDLQQKGGQATGRKSLQNTPPAPSLMHNSSALLTSTKLCCQHLAAAHALGFRPQWTVLRDEGKRVGGCCTCIARIIMRLGVPHAAVKGEDTVPAKAIHVTRSPASGHMLDTKLHKLLQVPWSASTDDFQRHCSVVKVPTQPEDLLLAHSCMHLCCCSPAPSLCWASQPLHRSRPSRCPLPR